MFSILSNDVLASLRVEMEVSLMVVWKVVPSWVEVSKLVKSVGDFEAIVSKAVVFDLKVNEEVNEIEVSGLVLSKVVASSKAFKLVEYWVVESEVRVDEEVLFDVVILWVVKVDVVDGAYFKKKEDIIFFISSHQ